MRGTFEIFAADALAGYRNMRRRLARSRLYTAWSVVLMLTAFGAATWLVAFINRSGGEVQFPMELNDMLFLYLLVFMGKSILDTYHYLVEREASVFLLAQPLPPVSIALGKLMTTLMFNLGLLAFGLGTITAMTFIHPSMHFVIPPDLVVAFILLTVLASVLGFTYAVLSGLGSWPRKLTGAALYSPVMSSAYLLMVQFRVSGWLLDRYLAFILLLAIAGLPAASHLLLESWNSMTRSGLRRHARHPTRISGPALPGTAFLRRHIGRAGMAVHRKELRTLLRRREGLGNAMTLAGLLVFVVYFQRKFQEFMELPGGLVRLVPVIVSGLALYLAVVSLGLVPALGAVSRDGKSAWLLKVAPVPEREIILGKLLAVMVMLPFIIAFVAVPIPLISGLSPLAVLFAAIGAAAMFFLAAGMGIWHGARHPNFDESSGNAPDVMTMYAFMLLLLLASAVLLLPPLAVAMQDRFLGFLALVMSLDISLAVLYAGTRGAARGLALLEL